MSIEIKTTNLEEIRKIAEELLEKAESAEDVATRNEANKDLDTAINTYTAISKESVYRAAKASDDPMKFAVLAFTFPTIKVKVEKIEDVETRKIVDAVRPIDLGNLHEKIGGIGADHKWLYTAESLNYYLTVRAAKRVNAVTGAYEKLIAGNDSFKMNEISRSISLGKDPCSNTQILKTLNIVIAQMLGEEYKATSHDVNYLVDVYANDNKKSKTGITAANHRTLRAYLKKICYRILTNGTGYDVDQKEYRPENG